MPMMTSSGSMGLEWAAAVVVTAIVILTTMHLWHHRSTHPPASLDPLVTARERFARGEMTQGQFDEIVDRLLTTEEHQP